MNYYYRKGACPSLKVCPLEGPLSEVPLTSNLKRLIEEVLGANDHTPHHRDGISQYVQAKDECVQLKQGLVAIVLSQQFDQSVGGLRLVFQVEQAKPENRQYTI